MAHGYGQHVQPQTPIALNLYPAQELFRAEDRTDRRLWGSRWNAARRQLGESTSALPVDAPNGTADSGMYAIKNDPIWETISTFGLPYAPFDFNSGMDVRDISFEEAQSLGLISNPSDIPAVASRGFNDDLTVNVLESGKLLASLLQSLGNTASFKDGILTFLGGL